ncbi:uncharacterized protein LOC134225663 [Armigeres subalbatus]|uniref:uncharacterized protein LOC134225663 n=1 Tax=Armigeres subalbatus TaxID=124917 RepID=UPI002ED62A6B
MAIKGNTNSPHLDIPVEIRFVTSGGKYHLRRPQNRRGNPWIHVGKTSRDGRDPSGHCKAHHTSIPLGRDVLRRNPIGDDTCNRYDDTPYTIPAHYTWEYHISSNNAG